MKCFQMFHRQLHPKSSNNCFLLFRWNRLKFLNGFPILPKVLMDWNLNLGLKTPDLSHYLIIGNSWEILVIIGMTYEDSGSTLRQGELN